MGSRITGMPRTKQPILEFVQHMDRLPAPDRIMGAIEQAARSIGGFYGFEEIVPALIDDPRAYSALIKAGLLDEQPPVLAKTRAGDDIVVRPSGVLGILRAYVSHRMQDMAPPLKFSVRGERYFLAPKHSDDAAQGYARRAAISAEQEWSYVMIGEESAVAEAEIIQILWKILQELRVGDRQEAEVRINAAGCASCRGSFRSALGNYLRSRKMRLCVRSRRDLKKAPAKIFSCADEKCRIIANLAPQTLDFLCESCKHHVRDMLEFLDEAGIPYFLDSRFFREGSHWSTVIFEFTVRSLHRSVAGASAYPDTASPEQGSAVSLVPDAPSHLAEGGRVSGAASLIAGKEIHAAAGVLFPGAVEKFLRARWAIAPAPLEEGVFLVQLGDLAKRKSFMLMETLRSGGIAVKESLGRDSIKAQLKIAERLGSRYALIIGQKEALDGTVIVREAESGIQETVPQEKLIEFLKKKLKDRK